MFDVRTVACHLLIVASRVGRVGNLVKANTTRTYRCVCAPIFRPMARPEKNSVRSGPARKGFTGCDIPAEKFQKTPFFFRCF